MNNPEFSELHDAVLEEACFDWARGTVSLVIGIGGDHAGRWLLVADGVTSMTIPRDQPWGPSTSIMQAEVAGAGGYQRLTVFMQSGDEITVVGARFRLTTP